MEDVGLEQAFTKVRAFLEGDFEHPGLTIYDLHALVGYNPNLNQDPPLLYTLPPEPATSGVKTVRFYYYPNDPEVTLIVEIEDKGLKRHIRHFKWNGISWNASRGKKSDLTATREVLPALESVGEDFFIGFAKEEAVLLSDQLRGGEGMGARYMLCTRDNTRIYYPSTGTPPMLPCPKCGNTNLVLRTISAAAQEDKIDAILREQRALRQSLEDLLVYLKRKLGS